MDLSFGIFSDQPASTRNHDGHLVEECCQSVSAALDLSTTDHEIPPLKAGTSKSESSKTLSLHYESDKNDPPSSDAHGEDEDLFSNSGSGGKYQPSSTPSSRDNEALSDKEKKSSRHRILEKDYCHQSSSEHEEQEALDLRIDKSPHTPERRKGGQMQQSGNKAQKVTVNTSQKNGKRTWSKAQYCVYCGKSIVKMARHLQRQHKDEVDVSHALSFPVRSKERKVLLENLRNKGNWQHNLKVLKEGNGEIVTWKRPSEKASVNDYLPCQHCYAMFKRTELWRHEKACRVRTVDIKKGKRGRIQKASSHLLPVSESSDGIQNVFHTMLQDKVTSQIRSDPMIRKYGDTLFARKGREQSQHRYISRKMRELGRFVLAAKEIDKSVKGLKDLCDPTKFDLTIKAARRVSNYNTSTSEYAKPSTAVKIGFSLKGATEAWIGHCLMTSDVLGEKKAKKFKELLESSWSSYVSTNAHSTMEQRRWNKEDCVPLTEDVITLQNYLRKIEDESKAELKKYYRQTDKTFQVAKIGKLPFAMEQGAESLKGKNLKTLDSVVFDERHDRPPTTDLRRSEERQTSDDDRPLEVNDDGDQQHLSTTSSSLERPMNAATRRRHDDNARSESDMDGEERHSITRKCLADRHKKGTTTKYDDYDVDEDSEHDVEEQQTARGPPAKRQKTATKHDDDDGDWSDDERGRRPWTDREKNAVQRRMAKFIALRKVPGKTDCLLCIGKESPVLRTRTWKDIKYFVYNEIIKIKKGLDL